MLLTSVNPTKSKSVGSYFFQSSQPAVGFVGLGNMGNHMARNLLKKGYPVVAYDISQESLAALKKDGELIDSISGSQL